MNQLPPSPGVIHQDRFEFFWKFANQGVPRHRWQIVTGINDTGGKQWEQLSNC